MPFGLTNAPATFQKYVNWVLREKLNQKGVAYVDNILVTGHNQVTHREKVQKILMKLYKARLRAKQAKCRFEIPRVEFLEYVVGKEGVSTDPKKTQALEIGARQRRLSNFRHSLASSTSTKNLSKEQRKKAFH